jgi:FkbM family methyltransferase
MDRELQVMLQVTRRIPSFPHSTAIVNRGIKPLYLRKQRQPVQAEVLGARMVLDPAETVDSNLLFQPQLYDPEEIAFLRSRLHGGDVFLDIGSNIGFYALVAAKLVGPKGRVLAIEADPTCFGRLRENVELNGYAQVTPLNIGVSDKAETLRLSLHTSGNRGGNSFLGTGEHGVDVPCLPLLTILLKQGIQRVTMAKFDIEGFEHRVLVPFLAAAPRSLLPETVIVEYSESLAGPDGGNPIDLLRTYGYVLLKQVVDNHIMELRDR